MNEKNKVIKLTEAQLQSLVKKTIRDILKEQGPMGWPSANPLGDSNKLTSTLDTNTQLSIISFISAFIPVIGPYISAGIMLGSAAIEYNKGNKKSAALTATFALLPGIGAIVSKIPGVKELGVKGMTALANKIMSGGKLTNTELQVAKGISQNKNLVGQQVIRTVSEMAELKKSNDTDNNENSQQKLLGLLRTSKNQKSVTQNFTS